MPRQDHLQPGRIAIRADTSEETKIHEARRGFFNWPAGGKAEEAAAANSVPALRAVVRELAERVENLQVLIEELYRQRSLHK